MYMRHLALAEQAGLSLIWSEREHKAKFSNEEVHSMSRSLAIHISMASCVKVNILRATAKKYMRSGFTEINLFNIALFIGIHLY